MDSGNNGNASKRQALSSKPSAGGAVDDDENSAKEASAKSRPMKKRPRRANTDVGSLNDDELTEGIAPFQLIGETVEPLTNVEPTPFELLEQTRRVVPPVELMEEATDEIAPVGKESATVNSTCGKNRATVEATPIPEEKETPAECTTDEKQISEVTQLEAAVESRPRQKTTTAQSTPARTDEETKAKSTPAKLPIKGKPVKSEKQKNKGSPSKRSFLKKVSPESKKKPPETVEALAEERRRRGVSLTARLLYALEYEPLAKVREAIKTLIKEGHQCNIAVTRTMLDGTERSMTPIMVWASDRYDRDSEFYHPLNKTKPFLYALESQEESGEDTMKEEAAEILRMLLVCGADPYSKLKPENMTLLHICAGGQSPGQLYCLLALLDQVQYSLDHLSIKDAHGDTVLHAALSNGSFDCARVILFETEKICSTMELLKNLHDDRGNNILASLVRYTDLPYDEPPEETVSSLGFDLFRELVDHIAQTKEHGPLLSENTSGENAFAVAAKGGCFYELSVLAGIKHREHWTVANVCTNLDEMWSPNVKSPLDLAMKTREMLHTQLPEHAFEEAGICSVGLYLENPEKKKCWLAHLNKCIDLLEEIQTPLPCTMEFVRETRLPDGSAELWENQKLTPSAENLKREMERKNADKVIYGPSEWDFLNRSSLSAADSALTQDAVRRLECGRTIGSVEPAMIRDPKDPCHRASSKPTAHFGLRATKRIERRTIICEYAGLVRREDESRDLVPEYAVKLEKCDEYILDKHGNAYAKGFLLDGGKVFNEGSLVNDVRWSLVGDYNPSTSRVVRKSSTDVSPPKFPVGTKFSKEFPPHGTFEGVVVAYKKPHYKVHYAKDCDCEDLTEAELSRLVKQSQNGRSRPSHSTGGKRRFTRHRQAELSKLVRSAEKSDNEESDSASSGKKKRARPAQHNSRTETHDATATHDGSDGERSKSSSGNKKRPRHRQAPRQEDPEAKVRDANATYLEVLVKGWPHIFVITSKPINAGEWILMDYGSEYWENITNKRNRELRQQEQREIDVLRARVQTLLEKI